jgi:dipeptidyl aminopeptidase/acylaminoacyl peptidase
VDKIEDPIALYQGEEDQVVPRAQSDSVASSLRQRGVPYVYHVYPGEGHGFRKSETIAHFYQTVEEFLRERVLFS